MNIWNISGQVIKHGIKGTKYPKLWVLVSTLFPSGSGLNDNKLFVTFDLDINKQSNNGRIGDLIIDKLKNNDQIFISEAMLTKLQMSKKDDQGNWVNEDIIGVKAKIRNITLGSHRYPVINTGFAAGSVTKYTYNPNTKEEKFIIGDRYRSVSSDEWKTRDMPVFRVNVQNPLDLTSKHVFVEGTLCGTTLTGESKVYVWANKLIVS